MPSMTPRDKLFLAVAATVLVGALVAFITRGESHRWDFRNNLWGPAHLLVTGRSPYEVWEFFPEKQSYAVWMPSTVGVLFALGYLPEAQATNLWLLMILGAAGLMTALVREGRPMAPGALGLMLGVVLLFPPFVANIALGQFSMLATALLLLSVRALKRPLLLGLLVVLASAKPQLIVLPVLALVFAVYRLDRWAGVARFTMSVVLWAAVCTLPLWVGYPSWSNGLWESFRRNAAVTWYQPNLFTWAPLLLGSPGYVVWAALAFLALALVPVLWTRLPPAHAMMWTMALNALIAVYAWTWDFVMLLPVVLLTMIRAREWKALLVLGAGYLLSCIMMFATLAQDAAKDGDFVWFPWVTLGYVAAAHARNTHRERV